MMQIDNVYGSQVPVSNLSARYDHKLYTVAASYRFTFPNLTGSTETHQIEEGSFDHIVTSSEIISNFFTKANMEHNYSMMLSSCPITGDEASVYLSSLMSGLHYDSIDNDRLYVAYLGLNADSTNYTTAIYGRFDENGDPIYPSSALHLVYRTFNSTILIEDDGDFFENEWVGTSKWTNSEWRSIAQIYGEFYSDRQARDSSLTGFVHVGSPRKMTYQVEREGDYRRANIKGGYPGRFLNVYRNSITSSLPFTEIENYRFQDSRLEWSYILDDMNIGNSVCWKFNTNQYWFQHPDKVLNYEGKHDWAVEGLHLKNGNGDWMLDFRTEEELANSFFGAQIDGVTLRVMHNSDTFYGRALFRNGEFQSGAWWKYGSQTSGFIE